MYDIFCSLFYSGSDEQKFLEASMAYVAGKPILSDTEFDQLKLRLKVRAHCYLSLIVNTFSLGWFSDFIFPLQPIIKV